MFYRPKKVTRMWDTWMYYHEGVHYAYHLHYRTGVRFDGVSLATSEDGVHFTEIGPVLHKRKEADWLGSGAVWKADGKFVMNFSEQIDGIQMVFFARSDDLVHWERLGDEHRFEPDPRWYDDTTTGRWDCIDVIPREEGGYWGFLTARPWPKRPGVHFESIGVVESADGLRWQALPPPEIDWGDWPAMDLFPDEVGSVGKFGDRYYLLLNFAGASLGNRHAPTSWGGKHGMHVFIADEPRGPFRPDKEAFFLVAGFPRFYRTPEGVLVHQRLPGRAGRVWLPPLKRAIIDEEGHLRLAYREGNEAAKGAAINLDLESCIRICPLDAEAWKVSAESIEVDVPNSGALILFENHFDLERGVVLEGDVTLGAKAPRWGGMGIYIEEDAAADAGLAVVAQTRGRTEAGTLKRMAVRPLSVSYHGGKMRFLNFAGRDAHPVGMAEGNTCRFRMLLRRDILELYVDDRLVHQVSSVPEKPTGRLGLIVESAEARFRNLEAWHMSF